MRRRFRKNRDVAARDACALQRVVHRPYIVGRPGQLKAGGEVWVSTDANKKCARPGQRDERIGQAPCSRQTSDSDAAERAEKRATRKASGTGTRPAREAVVVVRCYRKVVTHKFTRAG